MKAASVVTEYDQDGVVRIRRFLDAAAHCASGISGNSMGLAALPPHEDKDVFRATLEPADAVIHHCQTIHWSAANQTDRTRCGLLLVFRAAHAHHDPEMKAAYEMARAVPW